MKQDPTTARPMRVLILSQWYQPEPEPKIHLLARDLAGRGHTVTAITGIPNYPTGRVFEGYRLRPWPQVEMRDGVRVLRVPLYPDHSRSATRRVLNYASFALSAAFMGPILSGPADVMWVYHPPLTVALPALVLAATRRIPFVYEIQDLWPESLAASGMVRSPLLLGAVGRIAGLVYRAADRLTVISPGFKRSLVARGVAEEKIEVIPNWADEDLFRPVPIDRELACESGMRGKFNILYAGNMGPAQGLGNLIDAAAFLADEADVQFVLAGDGVEEHQLRARAEKRRLGNVKFLGRVPATRVPRLAALSDVLLVHLAPDPLYEITIPSKTISALACGRPIITVSKGDPASVIEEAGAGFVCAPGDPRALADCVRVMYKMRASERALFGQAARAHFLTKFSRAKLVGRYEQVLQEVAGGRLARPERTLRNPR